jgi:hypothetical protein
LKLRSRLRGGRCREHGDESERNQLREDCRAKQKRLGISLIGNR